MCGFAYLFLHQCGSHHLEYAVDIESDFDFNFLSFSLRTGLHAVDLKLGNNVARLDAACVRVGVAGSENKRALSVEA